MTGLLRSRDGSRTIVWSTPSPEELRRTAAEVRAAAAALQDRSTSDIINSIDSAVHTLMQPGEPFDDLVRGVAAFTGYSAQMTTHVLLRMARDWSAPSLERLYVSEFGSLHAQPGDDVPIASPSLAPVALRPPHLALHIFSGNVPGVAVTSIIRALLIRSGVIGKSAAGEPLLVAAFATALRQTDPELADAIHIAYWPGGLRAVEDVLLQEVEQVVHYGSATSIADISARMPARVRLVEHGPRLSFGIVAADALVSQATAESLSRDIAYATAMFDQQGCVSPHAVFVQEGDAISPRAFAAMIARSLADISADLPPAKLHAADAAAIRAARTDAEFRAIAGEDVDIHGDDMLVHTVIFDPVQSLMPGCLNRTLRVHPVASLRDVLPIAEPLRTVLQSAAIAAAPATLKMIEPLLMEVGVTRITTFRELPWPDPAWHHDGRPPLRELLLSPNS